MHSEEAAGSTAGAFAASAAALSLFTALTPAATVPASTFLCELDIVAVPV